MGNGAAGTGCAVPWALEHGSMAQTQAGSLGIGCTCNHSYWPFFFGGSKISILQKRGHGPACGAKFQSIKCG